MVIEATETNRRIIIYNNIKYFFLCFVNRTSLYILFQMKPTGCTLLYGWLSGVHTAVWVAVWCAHSCMGGCLVWTLLYGWLSGVHTAVWVAVWSAHQTATQPPIQTEKYQCRIDTVISPDDGHTVARNMQKSWNNYTKKQCALSWLHLKKTKNCTICTET